MLGLLTFLDPPRPDTKETIFKAMEYGVDVKMVTGGWDSGFVFGWILRVGFVSGLFQQALVMGTNTASKFKSPVVQIRVPPRRRPQGPRSRWHQHHLQTRVYRDPNSNPRPAGDHVLIAKETARMLGMGTNIKDAKGLPTMEAGGKVPKDLGEKYGAMILEADGFAQASVCDAPLPPPGTPSGLSLVLVPAAQHARVCSPA